MKRLPLFFISLLLMLCSLQATGKGYRITLQTSSQQEDKYILAGWKWGDQTFLDTVEAKKGKAVFAGKENLKLGSYGIYTLSGKKVLDFNVPAENGNFRLSVVCNEEEYKVKKADKENSIFLEFQNIINYSWEEFNGVEAFVAKINSLKEQAQQKAPGSITAIILENVLFSPESAAQMREQFPFADTAIINTPFVEDKVQQYLTLLQYNHNDTIIKHVNSLIAEGGNSELQARLAYTAYDFFYHSSIMGQEGIAVDIAQNWFLNGKLEWPNKEGLFMLKTFVEFNRHSLIGMEAPELNLPDTTGTQVALHSLMGEYTILYFYTDDCITCRKETPMLVDFVNEYSNAPLSVYAVYANDNATRWKEFINEGLYIYNPFTEWANVYDPDYSSGFQMLYNVIKTPQMYLLDRNKVIIGRGLNVKALKELLAAKTAEKEKTRELIENFFAPMATDTARIKEGIGMFYNSCKDNPDMFREFMEEIYTTLGRSQDYALQYGAAYLGEKYIVGMPEKWNSSIVERVKSEISSFNMNRLGSQAAELELERADKSPIKLSDVSTKYKVLYFYRPNCGMCAEVTPKMAELYNKYRDLADIEFVAINLGNSYPEWISYITSIGADWENTRGPEGNSTEIYRSYHLENIPAIYLLEDGKVVAKNINDIQLEDIIKNIIQ